MHSPSAVILEPPKIKSDTVSPSISHEVMGPDAMISVMVTAAMKLKTLTPWKKSYDQPGQHIKKQRHYFANKGPSSQGYG